jgi:hypothetical protein
LTKVTQDILVHFGGYAFGGDREKEQNFNDLTILNLATMDWKLLEIEGELPGARSSHSANAYKSSLYIFGGLFRQNSKARFLNEKKNRKNLLFFNYLTPSIAAFMMIFIRYHSMDRKN